MSQSIGRPMEPEETYLQNLGTIERIARCVARRNHLNADETDEFTQEVRVRLLDNDYAIIRKFEGRARLSTYLTTVIPRLYQEYRTKAWGKWRPSAEARRLGDKAITLERLLTRNGYTFDEAVKELTTPAGSQYTVAELEAIYLRLPPRSPRPVLVSSSSDDAPDVAATDSEADNLVEMSDRERSGRRIKAEVDRLFESMDAEDRLILQLRFWQTMKVPDIADRLDIPPKKLYKRIEKLFSTMRRALETAGLSKADIATVLCHPDQDIHFEILAAPGEIRPFRPSNQTGGEDVRGREGGMR